MACPICGKAASGTHKPFCSDRCKTVDLGRWLNGSYAVPVVEDDEGLPEGSDNEGPDDTGKDRIHH